MFIQPHRSHWGSFAHPKLLLLPLQVSAGEERREEERREEKRKEEKRKENKR